MAKEPSTKDTAWRLFDAIVKRAPLEGVNPWQADGSFAPDDATLRKLLAVPLRLRAGVQSGVPALALDVWIAYELRRAGLEPDWVWPRATPPRVVSRDVLRFVESVPEPTRGELMRRIGSGRSNKATTMAGAKLLGKNYPKQVDVVVSAWETGPEVLISTKRMDSSFGNNAANRIEESYGDAKNLRLRYPQAACGFLLALRSTAWDQKPRPGEAGIADRLVDLVVKMAAEADAYHATCVVVPEYSGEAPDDTGAEEGDGEDQLALGPAAEEEVDVDVDIDAELSALPDVRLRTDLVPAPARPDRFLKTIMDTVLANTPVAFHRRARARRSEAARPTP
jgi:hypothetical protein